MPTFTHTTGPVLFTNGFLYAVQFKIPAYSTTSDLTNFPLAINITLPTAHVQSGNDFRFGPDCQTVWDCQIEHYNSSTGALTAWVRIPTIQKNWPTEFYLFYGKPGATDPSTATTFDSQYELVAHLKEATAPFHDAGQLATTSTTTPSINTPSQTNGIAYKGQSFGGNQWVQWPNVGDGYDFNPGDFDDGDFYDSETSSLTIEAWINIAGLTGDTEIVVARGITSPSHGQGWQAKLGFTQTGKATASVKSVVDEVWEILEIDGFSTISLNTWHHLAATFNTLTGEFDLYLDGELEGTATTINTTLVPFVGSYLGRCDNANYFTGKMDEARISNTARSMAWIKATADNGNGVFPVVSGELLAIGLHGRATLAANYTANSPSGGLGFGGSAALNASYNATGHGGITTGGTATSTISTHYNANGGLVFGGSASSTVGTAISGHGGIVFGGNSTDQANYTFTASGGLTFGGSAANNSGTGHFTGTGGFSFNGHAVAKPTLNMVPTGGIAFGAGAQAHPAIARTGTGGVVFGGSATKSFTNNFAFIPNGKRLVFGGAGAASPSYSPAAATNGLAFSGTSKTRPTYHATASGGLNWAGVGNAIPTYRFVAGPGLGDFSPSDFNGDFYIHRPTAIAFGGNAELGTFYFASEGALEFAGQSDTQATYIFTADGGIRLTPPIRTTTGNVTSQPIYQSTITAQPTYSGKLVMVPRYEYEQIN